MDCSFEGCSFVTTIVFVCMDNEWWLCASQVEFRLVLSTKVEDYRFYLSTKVGRINELILYKSAPVSFEIIQICRLHCTIRKYSSNLKSIDCHQLFLFFLRFCFLRVQLVLYPDKVVDSIQQHNKQAFKQLVVRKTVQCEQR